MLSRWCSPRAMLLHLALLAWVAGCAAAAYWQVGRAIQGNQYSYLYAVEWPVFGIAGIFGWWALIHSDPVTAEARAARREVESQRRAAVTATRRDRDAEDPDLAAYNDHLAELAASGKRRGWRH